MMKHTRCGAAATSHRMAGGKLILAIILMSIMLTGYGGMCSKKSSESSGSSAPAPALVLSVATNPATEITQTTTTLNGTITPTGVSTVAYFQWGPTQSYGNTASYQNIGSGTSPINLIANLTGLTPDTIYNFRIVASGGGSAQGVNRTFTTDSLFTLPAQVGSPTPAIGAINVPTNQQLSWAAASRAVSYNVYFGTTAEFVIPVQTGIQTPSYTPGTLSINTLYYWRIDSVNDGGTTTGIVWSFTTAAIAAPAQVSSPTPANGAINIPIDQQLSWGAVSGATYNVYFGATSPGAFIGNQPDTTYNPDTLTNSTLYYWRIDSTNAVSGTTTGNVWSFTTIALPPARVGSPSPSNGAVNVLLTTTLSWASATGATSYDVYFGTTAEFVSPVETGIQTTSYGPGTLGTLSVNTLYYWRIDSVNAGGTTPGEVWSFTTVATAPTTAVDDYCWVANYGSNNVTRIRKLDSSTTTIAAVGTNPFGVAVDETYVWVANLSSSNVTRILKSTGVVYGSPIPVGIGPRGIAVDDTYVWVTNYATGQNSVTRILKSDLSTTTIPVGTQPLGVAVDGTYCWVANYASGDVTRILKSDITQTTTIPVGTGTGPSGIAVDGTYVWVANNTTNTVTLILKSDLSTTTTAVIDGTNPRGIAVDETYCWVANYFNGTNGNSVTRILKSDITQTTTIPVGTQPYGVAVDETYCWVANYNNSTNGNSVTRILKSDLTTTTIQVGTQPYSLGDMTGYAFDNYSRVP